MGKQPQPYFWHPKDPAHLLTSFYWWQQHSSTRALSCPFTLQILLPSISLPPNPVLCNSPPFHPCQTVTNLFFFFLNEKGRIAVRTNKQNKEKVIYNLLLRSVFSGDEQTQIPQPAGQGWCRPRCSLTQFGVPSPPITSSQRRLHSAQGAQPAAAFRGMEIKGSTEKMLVTTALTRQVTARTPLKRRVGQEDKNKNYLNATENTASVLITLGAHMSL